MAETVVPPECLTTVTLAAGLRQKEPLTITRFIHNANLRESMASRLNALLLAAGNGTRLRPVTDVLPKCLVPLAGRPVLDYWLELLGQVDCRTAVVNTHAHADRMRDYLTRPKPPAHPLVVESYEPKLLGSAGTLAANVSLADDAMDVCVVYSDQLSDVDLSDMYRFHRSHGDALTMLVYEVANPSACGIVETDDVGRVVSFEEKPVQPRSNLANAGVYFIRSAAFRELAERGGFDIAFDLLPSMVGRMRVWKTDGVHRDIGTLAAYHQAQGEASQVLKKLANRVGPSPAVFFDRDGTLIESRHYLRDSADVQVMPDAAEAITALRHHGYRCLVVSNQSGIGRNLITEQEYQAVNSELVSQLATGWGWLDGFYHCPIVPDTTDRTLVEHYDRKPGPGMLIRAAREWNLDLSRSWMIGDMVSDALAGGNAGCAGSILLGDPLSTSRDESADWPVVTTLTEAVRHILRAAHGEQKSALAGTSMETHS